MNKRNNSLLVQNKPTPSEAATDQRRYIRRAMLYITALWGKPMSVVASACREDARIPVPCIANETICLPGEWLEESSNAARIRAASAHAAAHAIYGGRPFEAGDLRPRQKILIEVIEDARVEFLACRKFPGLRRLWLSQFQRDVPEVPGFGSLVRRMALSLLDTAHRDSNDWVRKGVEYFHAHVDRISDTNFSRELGILLAYDLGQMRLPVDEGGQFYVSAYRDDNRHLWMDIEESQISQDTVAEESQENRPRESVFFQESDHGVVLEIAEQMGGQQMEGSGWLKVSQENAVLEFRNTREPSRPQAVRYPEWHYRMQLARQDWCTVYEHELPQIPHESPLEGMREYRVLLQRMQRVMRSVRLEKQQRVRRQKEGDEIDLDAAICSLGEWRAGREPDYRVHVSARHLHDRGLASLVLLDLSESMNDRIDSHGTRILDVMRTACTLLAQTIRELDEPFALQGFCSNTRHEVRNYSIKSFAQVMDDAVLSRIAAIEARYSTRMGAAIRHAQWQLQQQEQNRKLLLLVTDGTPSDVDVYDPLHLVNDARQAVLEAKRSGVLVYALCLDPTAGESMSRIFGRGHFTLLDHLERLPEMLAAVFLRLIRGY